MIFKDYLFFKRIFSKSIVSLFAKGFENESNVGIKIDIIKVKKV